MNACDNIDRIMRDVVKQIEKSPDPAFLDLLSIWQARVERLQRPLPFNMVKPDTTLQELQVWQQAIRELEAACAAHRGDAKDVLKILLEETQNED